MTKSVGAVMNKILSTVVGAAIIGGAAMLSGHSAELVKHEVQIEQCTKETAQLKADLKEMIKGVDEKVDDLGKKIDVIIMHQMRQEAAKRTGNR